MFWFTNSIETFRLFNKNIYPNVICRKAPRNGPPFDKHENDGCQLRFLCYMCVILERKRDIERRDEAV